MVELLKKKENIIPFKNSYDGRKFSKWCIDSRP